MSLITSSNNNSERVLAPWSAIAAGRHLSSRPQTDPLFCEDFFATGLYCYVRGTYLVSGIPTVYCLLTLTIYIARIFLSSIKRPISHESKRPAASMLVMKGEPLVWRQLPLFGSGRVKLSQA